MLDLPLTAHLPRLRKQEVEVECARVRAYVEARKREIKAGVEEEPVGIPIR